MTQQQDQHNENTEIETNDDSVVFELDAAAVLDGSMATMQGDAK